MLSASFIIYQEVSTSYQARTKPPLSSRLPCGIPRIFEVRRGIDSKLSSSEILIVVKPDWSQFSWKVAWDTDQWTLARTSRPLVPAIFIVWWRSVLHPKGSDTHQSMNPYMKILTVTCTVERSLESGSLPQSDFRDKNWYKWEFMLDVECSQVWGPRESNNLNRNRPVPARLKWFKILGDTATGILRNGTMWWTKLEEIDESSRETCQGLQDLRVSWSDTHVDPMESMSAHSLWSLNTSPWIHL